MTTTNESLWRAFAAMGDDNPPVTIARASGSHVTGDDGVEYLDAVAGLWYCNIGHGRQEIADAVRDQLLRLDHYPSFGGYQNAVATELADELAEIAPFPDAKVLFQSGGSDGVDSAVKLARRHWIIAGRPTKSLVVSREHAYHGVHGYGTALGGIPRNRQQWGTLDRDVAHVPWNSVESVRALVADQGADRIAAIIAEPVIGSGGIFAPDDEYFPEIRRICDENDILLISDAVISGFGRLGNWFGMERWNVVPDLIVCAKGLTSGYFPLGAVLASERIWRPYYEPGGPDLLHGNTYTGHATGCLVGLLVIDILRREQLFARAQQIESRLAVELTGAADLEAVAEVRAGTGAMAAVELAPDLLEGEPDAPRRLAAWIREHKNVIVRPLPRALALAPPLTISDDELTVATDALLAGVEHAGLSGGRRAGRAGVRTRR